MQLWVLMVTIEKGTKKNNHFDLFVLNGQKLFPVIADERSIM
jgi:hypothetical protein